MSSLAAHDSLSNTEAGSQADILSTEDIKIVKNFLRTFESLAARENARPDKGLPEEQSTSPANRNESPDAQKGPDRSAVFNAYIRVSDDLKREIDVLLLQLRRVGGHEIADVVNQLEGTRYLMLRLDGALRDASHKSEPKQLEESIQDTAIFLRDIQIKCMDLLKTLYRQNHAFRFLQRLVGDLEAAQYDIARHTDTEAQLLMVFKNVVPQLTTAFTGLQEDFRSFSNKTLPKFVNEEEERATTRYLTLTTIATFFSSITATTLQFSFEGEANPLSGVVNLFWYLSLVFSVSSGINSLLSMIWRKSAVYTDEKRPPYYIKLWFTNAPIVFLTISAMAFIIGLCLFVYSSGQPTYVTNTTIGFATLHILGILIAILWFQFRLNWSSLFIQSLRRNIAWAFLKEDQVIDANRCIGTLKLWPAKPPRPSSFAKLIRGSMILLQTCIKGSKRYLFYPLQAFVKYFMEAKDSKRHAAKPVEKSTKEQVEHPPTAHNDLEKGPENKETVSINEVNRAIQEFYNTWGNTFTDPKALIDIRNKVEAWRRKSYPANTIDITLRSILWGYPDLLQQFQNKVLPVMTAWEESSGHTGNSGFNNVNLSDQKSAGHAGSEGLKTQGGTTGETDAETSNGIPCVRR